MAIPRLTDDLNIIAALGDNPNADNNMTAEELKAAFDLAANIIQAYINGTLVPAVEQNANDIGGKLSTAGASMKGNLDMAGNMLSGVPTPSEGNHAANKAYVDQKLVDIAGFTGEHKDLKGLDVADQHPMSAIIGLIAALADKAGTEHKHTVADVKEGVFSTDRLPTIPVNKGGFGGTTAAEARKNLGITPQNVFAAGDAILSSAQYGSTLPSSAPKGMLFFKKV